jgi:hypothetical protein
MWHYLSAWMRPTSFTASGQNTTPVHPTRTLTLSATVAYHADGTAAITVERTARFDLRDPMAASIEDGGIDQQRDGFDAMFGFSTLGSWGTQSQSLVTSSVSSGVVTASDTDLWSIGRGSGGVEFFWSPLLAASDAATARISAQGGFVVGVSGIAVPPHAADSIMLAAHGASPVSAEVALAPAGARPASVPDLAPGSPDLPGMDGLPPLGLGAIALAAIAALCSAALAYPALIVLPDHRARRSSGANIPIIAVAGTAALASVLAATADLQGDSWLVSESNQWILILIVPALMAVTGVARAFRLAPVLRAWADAVVGLSFAAGTAALVFLATSSTHPAASPALALGAMAIALPIGWRGPGLFARMTTVLIPVTVLRYANDAGSLGVLSSGQGSVVHWLADDAWPGALFAATAAAVALAAVRPRGVSAAWQRRLFCGLGVAGLPLLGVDAQGTPYWTTAAQSAVT